MNILIECFKNTDFKPSSSKTDKHNETHGFNLGEFWSNLMAGKNKQLFEDARKKYNETQKECDKHWSEKREKKELNIKMINI